MGNSTIWLDVVKDITLDDLKKIVAEAVGRAGCAGCGLNGFNLAFREDLVLPIERLKFDLSDLVTNVSVIEQAGRFAQVDQVGNVGARQFG